MTVSVKVSLGQATAAKHRRLEALLGRVQSLTGRYIRCLWEAPGGLDAATLQRVPETRLSYRHRSNCLKVALETVVSTKRSARALGKTATCPSPPKTHRLSSLVCHIERGCGSFDYVLKIAGLVPRRPITIPFKSHAVLNKWLSMPGAELLQGATMNEDFAILWIKLPDPALKLEGGVLAVDAGVAKLLVDSETTHRGQDCREVLARVRRRKLGSKGKSRALAARRDYMNRIVKDLPWYRIAAVAHEDLKGIKFGKRPNRGKQFRKLIAPWTIRQMFSRIEFLARLNRVRVVVVDPRDTSRRCPSCFTVSSENRRGERFLCVSCGHEQDADEVGAQNILSKALETLGSLWSPSSPKLSSRLS